MTIPTTELPEALQKLCLEIEQTYQPITITHQGKPIAIIWYSLGDPKLTPNLKAAIENPNNEIWLSPISVWETILLAEKGRHHCNSSIKRPD